MKNALHRDCPVTFEHDGKVYRIRPYFDRVLTVMEILDDDGLLNADKITAVRSTLVRGRAPLSIVPPLLDFLFPKQTKNQNQKKLYDFSYDAPHIYAAFLSAYGIDLNKQRGKLHWFDFIALFNALPDSTGFSKIISIRSRDIPAYDGHNDQEIQNLLKLKQAFALPVSDNDKRRNIENGLRDMYARLKSMT